MQINFTPKKLKEASKYVNLLNPPKTKKEYKVEKKEKTSFIKKILKFLFK